MIKGVNRHIIEVNDPEPACFERVILFLHKEANHDPALINRQTESYLSLLAASYRRKRQFKRWLLHLSSLLLAACSGGIISYLLFSQ